MFRRNSQKQEHNIGFERKKTHLMPFIHPLQKMKQKKKHNIYFCKINFYDNLTVICCLLLLVAAACCLPGSHYYCWRCLIAGMSVFFSLLLSYVETPTATQSSVVSVSHSCHTRPVAYVYGCEATKKKYIGNQLLQQH